MTARKRSEAGERAIAAIEARVDLVDEAGKAAEGVGSAERRAAKIVADAKDKHRAAWAAAIDGGWTAEQLVEFGVPVPDGVRVSKRRRKAAASSGSSRSAAAAPADPAPQPATSDADSPAGSDDSPAPAPAAG
jgi:hypothetical protein